MPVIIVATVKPVPAHRDEVRAALSTAAGQVHGEDGCELYALHRAEDRLSSRRSGPARPRCRRTPALPRCRSSMRTRTASLGGPLNVVLLEPVPGGHAAKGAL